MPSTTRTGATHRSRIAIACIAVIALLAAACTSDADDFPDRTITMIVPWEAGSASDIAIRLLSDFAEDELGQPINHQNVVGGNGSVGHQQIHDADPDGYTMGFFILDVLTNEALGETDVSYRDFEMLMQFGVQPLGLYATPSSGFTTVDELVEAAQEDPGEISMATHSLGGVFHQGAGLFAEAADVDFRYVPFDGSAEQVTAMLGDHVDVMVTSITLPAQYVESGEMVMLAAMTDEPLELHPDVPTMADEGYDVEYASWRGVGLPPETPEDIQETLLDAFSAAFENEEFQERAAEANIDLQYRDAEEFEAFLEDTYEQVEGVLVDLGFTD